MSSTLERIRAAAQRAGQLAQIAATARGLTNDHALSGPLYAQVSICDPCDHRCVMCCYHPPSEKRPLLEQFGGTRPGIMSLETFARLVTDLYEAGRGTTVTMCSKGSGRAERVPALVGAGLARSRLRLDAGRARTYQKTHVRETAESYARVIAGLANLVRARAGRAAPHVSVPF